MLTFFQKLATDIQREKEDAFRKFKLDETVRQIIEKHIYKIKNYKNTGKSCYIYKDLHVALNSEHVIRQTKYIDYSEATIFEPPYKLRKAWIKGAKKAAAIKKIKKI